MDLESPVLNLDVRFDHILTTHVANVLDWFSIFFFSICCSLTSDVIPCYKLLLQQHIFFRLLHALNRDHSIIGTGMTTFQLFHLAWQLFNSSIKPGNFSTLPSGLATFQLFHLAWQLFNSSIWVGSSQTDLSVIKIPASHNSIMKIPDNLNSF